MTARKPVIPVRLGFEDTSLRIPIEAILPLRDISDTVRKSVKYQQIAASIAEVGIIEPPVVTRDAESRDQFHLLDGHLRVDIIRARGEKEVVCLVAVDDEAYTYNKRVSRIATIQEHRMILTAIRKGVSEERLARALNVNISNIRTKRNLLARISHGIRCIGALNRINFFCNKVLSDSRGVPRCRQSVAQRHSILHA